MIVACLTLCYKAWSFKSTQGLLDMPVQRLNSAVKVIYSM